MPLFLSEYIPRNVVLVKTVGPSRNGPKVKPELSMAIKGRQALIELERKSVQRPMASEQSSLSSRKQAQKTDPKLLLTF